MNALNSPRFRFSEPAQRWVAAALAAGLAFTGSLTLRAADAAPASDLAALYGEITRTVEEVDFDGMAAAYHPAAVVVTADAATPVAQMIEKWRKAGVEQDDQGVKATVAFKVTSRIADETSAFDTGIFRYATTDAAGAETAVYVNYEALLVKEDGRWLWLMERQLGQSDEAQWQAAP